MDEKDCSVRRVPYVAIGARVNELVPFPDGDVHGKEASQRCNRPPAQQLWLHTGLGNTTRVLCVDEVLYFQTGDKYTEVVTRSERHLIRTSLRELRQRLDPEQFAQVHRSTIVNLRCIERIERDVLGRSFIHLRNHPDAISVGRAYVAQFRKM